MAGKPEARSGLHLGSNSKASMASQRIRAIHAFELLRERLHAQMAILETLARERADHQPTGLARDLSQRERDIQEARAELQAEADRIKRERALDLEELEHARQLLAQAWENLERAQLNTAIPVVDDRRLTVPTRQIPSASPPPTDVIQSETITRAVLEQFQSLRRDVRKNSQCKK